ncbi:MAG: carboxypeptidase-like regulatory domain-containing protein, partial [Bacteroidales bacterium]|nr:carboxypeptidase-like regulatory domain-containing protein [Bacteroidales bacterium]
MRKIGFLLFLNLCFLVPLVASAQGPAPKVPVSGHVIDASSEEVLPFVNVTLLSVKDSTLIDGTVTDEKGNFTIKGVKANGSFIMRLSFI